MRKVSDPCGSGSTTLGPRLQLLLVETSSWINYAKNYHLIAKPFCLAMTSVNLTISHLSQSTVKIWESSSIVPVVIIEYLFSSQDTSRKYLLVNGSSRNLHTKKSLSCDKNFHFACFPVFYRYRYVGRRLQAVMA
jgi:hypothetical protein